MKQIKKDKWIEIYSYLILTMGLFVLITTPLNFIPIGNFFRALIIVSSVIELIAFILSFVLIGYIFIKKIKMTKLVLPIIFIIYSIGIFIGEGVMLSEGIDSLDLSHLYSIIAVSIQTLFYIMMVVLTIIIIEKNKIP